MTIDVRLFAANGFVVAYDENEDKNRDVHGMLSFPRRLYVAAYDEEQDVVKLERLSWGAAKAVCKPALDEVCALFKAHREQERKQSGLDEAQEKEPTS